MVLMALAIWSVMWTYGGHCHHKPLWYATFNHIKRASTIIYNGIPFLLTMHQGIRDLGPYQVESVSAKIVYLSLLPRLPTPVLLEGDLSVWSRFANLELGEGSSHTALIHKQSTHESSALIIENGLCFYISLHSVKPWSAGLLILSVKMGKATS